MGKDFRGLTAPASLKVDRFDRQFDVGLLGFPGPHSPGLIEASQPKQH